MNIRTLTASAIVLATLASGAFAGTSNFINSGAGQSDEEVNFSIGRSTQNDVVVETSAKAFAVVAPKQSIGDYINETAEEANQRSSNR